MNKTFRIAAAAGLAFAIAALAQAQGVTGAGASFPAPLCAKWAADFSWPGAMPLC